MSQLQSKVLGPCTHRLDALEELGPGRLVHPSHVVGGDQQVRGVVDRPSGRGDVHRLDLVALQLLGLSQRLGLEERCLCFCCVA